MRWSDRSLFAACVIVCVGCGSDAVKKRPPMSSSGLGGIGAEAGAGGSGGTGGIIGGMVGVDAAVAEPPRDGAVDSRVDSASLSADAAALTPDVAAVVDAPVAVDLAVPVDLFVVLDTSPVSPDLASADTAPIDAAPVDMAPPDMAPPDLAADMAAADMAVDAFVNQDTQPDVAPDTSPDADLSTLCTPVGPRPALKKTKVAEGLALPMEIVAPPDEPNTLWVLEHRSGRVRVVKEGLPLSTLTQVTVTPSGGGRSSLEEGLFSIALHPNYTTNKLFYVFYSAADADTTVDEFVKNGGTATFSRNVYSRPSSHWFHNGGSIAFHPIDKQLHISVGDNEQASKAQDQEGDWGRILKINLDTKVGTTVHFGLRNPWRFSFDAQNGDMYIGDVGDSGDTSENVFYSPTGAAKTNFRWGGGGSRPPALDQTDAKHPIIGGIVYRGKAIPGLCGYYVYGRNNSGPIKTLKVVNGQATQVAASAISTSDLSSLGTNAAGELFFSERLSGEVYRIDQQ